MINLIAVLRLCATLAMAVNYHSQFYNQNGQPMVYNSTNPADAPITASLANTTVYVSASTTAVHISSGGYSFPDTTFQNTAASGGNTSATSKWVKYTVTYTQFSTAALTNTITLFNLPAGGVVQGVKIKHSVTFNSLNNDTATMSVGLFGDSVSRYASVFDVYQDVGPTAFQTSNNFDSQDSGSPTTITVTLTIDNDNLDQLTQGSADIWVLSSVAN